jgi:cobalt-precorrin 5A hydrolase/precorrin-3B C17-methyltransferase
VTARRIAAILGSAEIHGLASAVDGADVTFTQTGPWLRSLFEDGRPVIGVCAAAILIRTLGGLAHDKRSEPPVLAVSDDGLTVVPLLGGHHGANALARLIADSLGGTAAITTASDVRFGVAFDAPPPGCVLANPERAKAVTAALLAGNPVRIEGHAPWLTQSALPVSEHDAAMTLSVTDEAVTGEETRLIYHPATLVLGVGCVRGCAPEELIELADETLAAHGLAPQSVALIASLDLKADEAAVHALAKHLGVPARFFPAETLSAETVRLANPSDTVLAEVGCPGVAEGAALAAVGPNGKLIVEKTVSGNATCAVARAPAPIPDPTFIGRARGRLSLVSIGPGSSGWRSAEADALLAAASDWVGYELYLSLLEPIAEDKTQHRFKLGEEEARARHALELAGEGRDVALVSSGDAGIYAMASLVFELIDEASGPRAVSPNARRAEIVVAPGISALQAAAAKIGAPLGHDFCAISLSDVLTPWEIIERRIEAAARGDLVTCFYNPRSKRRTSQLARAVRILAHYRPEDTPVIVAASLGRPAEQVTVTTLADFDPTIVDMLTLIIVGASTTRALTLSDGAQRVYTPRGYHRKGDHP